MKIKLSLVPYIIWMLIFVIIPVILIIYFSFTDINKSLSFDNILEAGKYSQVFLRSIIIGAISTVLCLIIGYPAAYLISKVKLKYQNFLIMLLMIPMWTSFLLRTYAWMTLLEYNGLINKLLVFLGLPRLNMINTPGAIILGMVYNFLPYMILPIYNILVKIDKKIIEAAQDLGANKFKVFTKIIFPLSLPGIISGITMVFVPSVSTFVISKMLGGGSILVIGDLIEMQFLGNNYNPYLGSCISLILMIIIMICMKIMNSLDTQSNYTEKRTKK
ncbi:MAG: ABC transporter permease [Clostridia bacterium]|nr:ABC transporter permease [Clostridia bacterium]